MPTFDSVIQLIIPEIEFHQNRYARGLGEAVTRDCRWLDVGAGTMLHHGWIGPTEQELVGRARSVVGCDVVIDHLRRNASLSASIGADARHLPFADNSFDLVTANMVLEHLVEPRQVFDEIARILVPGGRFIFVTPNRTNPVVWLASRLLTRTGRKALSRVLESRASEHIFYTFYRANSPEEIRRLIANGPMRPRCLEQFSSYPFIRKPWALTVLETLWIKVLGFHAFRALRSNVFGDLEKVGVASPRGDVRPRVRQTDSSSFSLPSCAAHWSLGQSRGR